MWLDAPLKVEKMMRENAFEQKKKKPGLKFTARVSANRLSNSWAPVF